MACNTHPRICPWPDSGNGRRIQAMDPNLNTGFLLVVRFFTLLGFPSVYIPPVNAFGSARF